ncbi:hypothetical protein SGRA_3902 [Saprospira grandis str. Lewin]|uniref:Uncharacterized protein n=1 Tax=Saprospira grandis (strain Lewin) TaxID=984262 RepID=H6L726_SAPGL|nr:hypothetical protein SGRA_3902 [Saprospira grandis str. Lewin]
MAVGFNLQARIAGPKGRRPRGLKGWPSGQTQPLKAAQGRADLRALKGPGRRRRQAPKKNR